MNRICLLVTASLGIAGSAVAETAWQPLTFPGVRETEYSILSMNEDDINTTGETITIVSDESSSMVYRPLAPWEQQAERLLWKWRVVTDFRPTDLKEKGEDDRPVAVHLLYLPKDAEPLSADATSSELMGMLDDSCLISFVWGGRAMKHDIIPSPHMEYGWNIILQGIRAPIGSWRSEEVNLQEIQQEIPALAKHCQLQPSYILISGDSDDTETRTQAEVGNIRFDYSKIR
jgi:hypothetical protein